MPSLAIAAAGALGAAGSIGSGFLQAGASKSAADAQLQAATQAQQLQAQEFGVGQAAVQPNITAGQAQIPTLAAMLAPNGQLASQLSVLQKLTNPGTAMKTLQTLPGFQFQSDWGTRAATNALSAQGLGGSAGPIGKAVSDYNSGLASSYYGQAVNSLAQSITGQQNAIGLQQNAVNTGANAASSLLGGAISSGNSQANSLITGGNAAASGILGSANAISNGITGATSSLGGGVTNALLLNSLLGGQNVAGLYGGGQAQGLML